MKYFFTALFVLISFSVFAQPYSDLDKAKIIFCLVKGRLGNFVVRQDTSFQYDAREFNAYDGFFEEHMFDMLTFSCGYYGFPSFNKMGATMLSNDTKNPVKHLHAKRSDSVAFGDAIARDIFLRVLPYHGIYYIGAGYMSDVITLKRIAGFSPLQVTKDYVDLIAVLYFTHFVKNPAMGIEIQVDMGTDGNVHTENYEYLPGTDWIALERSVVGKIILASPSVR